MKLKHTIMTPKEDLIQLITTGIERIEIEKQIAIAVGCEQFCVELHDNVISHFYKVKKLLLKLETSSNYINQFRNEVNESLFFFQHYVLKEYKFNSEAEKLPIKTTIESHRTSIEEKLQSMSFNYNFFEKLGYFQKNVVAIGANGSGKTTLSNSLKRYLPENGVVISAQKILIIPTFGGISNVNSTSQKLISNQAVDKTLKTTYSTDDNGNAYGILVNLGNDFKVLLDNLLAERSAKRNMFCDNHKRGMKDEAVPVTKLDKALDIWNSLIQHRIMKCEDGINITIDTKDSLDYPAYQMSDGEKVILYYIAQVLQAPESGFVIIDEPEMYLHKTILQKLWDTLEKERQDCLFVYLTHDLDFATSRATANKLWIKSFTYPDKWEIESIPENELPKQLLMELLGSRNHVLFCEGEKGSIDDKIYNILFPEFTITPVGTCSSVINYTKAFNKLPNINTKAYGLIDSDHHGLSRLEALKEDNIFSFSMTEPENLLLDYEFLKILAPRIFAEVNVIDLIREDVISLLEKDLAIQASNFVTAKINYHFKESHVVKGNSLDNVEGNFRNFTSEIKIQKWYEERVKMIKKIVTDKNYQEALSLYNNKGLRTIANKHFKISDFTERAIKLIQVDPSSHEALLKYFPEELKSGHIIVT